jgi:hypothetical protein
MRRMIGKETQEINSLLTTGFTLLRFIEWEEFGRTWAEFGMGPPVCWAPSLGVARTGFSALDWAGDRTTHQTYSIRISTLRLERYIATLSYNNLRSKKKRKELTEENFLKGYDARESA